MSQACSLVAFCPVKTFNNSLLTDSVGNKLLSAAVEPIRFMFSSLSNRLGRIINNFIGTIDLMALTFWKKFFN